MANTLETGGDVTDQSTAHAIVAEIEGGNYPTRKDKLAEYSKQFGLFMESARQRAREAVRAGGLEATETEESEALFEDGLKKIVKEDFILQTISEKISSLTAEITAEGKRKMEIAASEASIAGFRSDLTRLNELAETFNRYGLDTTGLVKSIEITRDRITKLEIGLKK